MKFINTFASLKQFFLALLMLCLCVINTQVFANVKASTNQNSYYQGDLITLTIESNENQTAELDLSPLNNNFEIKGTSTSSQFSINNGNKSFTKIWKVELQAKSLGKLVIPEIKVGDETTKKIEVEVKELPPEVAAETKKHIFIEAEVDINNSEIYVQQQIPYNVRFFYDAAMQTGEVILPTIENANIRVVGREKKYQVVRAGIKYVVVDRRYVISPEKSGKLIIPPTIVQGRMALTNGDSPQLRKRMDEVDMLNELFFDFNKGSTFNNPFDPFFSRRSIGPTRPYTSKSEAIEVNVLPVPESFTGVAWLPAEEVIMQDSWAKSPPTLKVGEPVTRKIIMQVKGLASSQIPEIFIPKPMGMKVYPEQVKGETPNDGNTIYGIQQVDISYIPDKSGNVVIPEIKVDWWDVKNKKQQTYTLPEWNLNVSAGALKPSEMNNEPEVMADLNPEPNTSIEEVFATIPKFWGWEVLVSLLAFILALLWVFIKLSKRIKRSPKQRLKKKNQKIKIDAHALRASLLDACNNNDNKATADLLLKHANYLSPEIKLNNLGALAKSLETGAGVIKALEESLYSDNTQQWMGNELHQLINHGLQFKQNKVSQEIGLAPLYPS